MENENLDKAPSVYSTENELQAQVDAIRHLVTSLLILVVVISVTFNIYLLRQYRTASKDFAGLEQQAGQISQRYNNPVVQDFIKKITEYGRTHPEFTPILAKYGVKPAVTSAPPATATPPRPATIAPKK